MLLLVTVKRESTDRYGVLPHGLNSLNVDLSAVNAERGYGKPVDPAATPVDAIALLGGVQRIDHAFHADRASVAYVSPVRNGQQCLGGDF